jgi:hypothetical protein
LKRLYTLLSLVVLFAVLAMPAVARADDPPVASGEPAQQLTPDGWTWDEAAPVEPTSADPAPADPAPDGWTWDEASPVGPTSADPAPADPAPDGWTWDEAVAPSVTG